MLSKNLDADLHRHSAIRYVTPNELHEARERDILGRHRQRNDKDARVLSRLERQRPSDTIVPPRSRVAVSGGTRPEPSHRASGVSFEAVAQVDPEVAGVTVVGFRVAERCLCPRGNFVELVGHVAHPYAPGQVR